MHTPLANEGATALLERLISRLFRVGVVLCAVLIAAGWLLGLAGHSRESVPPGAPQAAAAQGAIVQGAGIVRQLMAGSELRGGAPVLSGMELARRLAQGNPDALIAAGLMLLIALPILRVAVTVAVFTAQRDWAYVAMTALVLALLLSSLFLGRVL